MNQFCLAFYVLVSLALSVSWDKAYAEVDQRIAVLELSNPARLEKQEVQYLSDLLRRLASSELAQNFLVIDKANILELLPPDKTIEDCIGECAVETGRLLQAAYIITGDIIQFGKQLRVTIRLHDTKTGRLVASEVASGHEVTDMESGIQEAGGRLLRGLIKGFREISVEGTRERIEGRSQTFGELTQRVIVSLQSLPQGAAVVIDGVQICSEGTLVCEYELNEGAHQISMTKTDYFMRSETVSFSRDHKKVEWSLDPNFAILKVTTTPSHLKYTINGEAHEGSYTQRITPQKSYQVLSSDRCFDISGEKISAGKPGDEIIVNLAPTKLFAVVDVSARDQEGTPLEAMVSVDGDELGETPGQYRVPVCSKEILVINGPRRFTQNLSLSKDRVTRVLAILNLDVDCDVNSYVDATVGGYRGQVIALITSSAFIVSSIIMHNKDVDYYKANGLALLGVVGMTSSLAFFLMRNKERSEAFRLYKMTDKCNINKIYQSNSSRKSQISPILSPINGGGIFGITLDF